jgi:hypothetical protein
MDREESNTEASRVGDSSLDSGWDVVELEVEEHVEAGVDGSLHGGGPVAGEELEADFGEAHVFGEGTEQRESLIEAREVESEG